MANHRIIKRKTVWVGLKALSWQKNKKFNFNEKLLDHLYHCQGHDFFVQDCCSTVSRERLFKLFSKKIGTLGENGS